MKITDKARETLQKILKSFDQGNIPEAIAHVVIPPWDVPCSKWSLNNRILTFFADTDDARGIKQWRDVGRWPKKGSKAFYILVPLLVKKKKEDSEGEDADENKKMGERVLVGFRAMPVFRVGDTEGKPLEYPPVDPSQPPPLIEVAEQWGLSVKYQRFLDGFYGYYVPNRKEIGLATHDEITFFHELAHAAHDKVKDTLTKGQDWRQEIVAELTAATLLHLYGKCPNDGLAYQYIAHYAKKANRDVYRACLSVIADTEQCLNLILSVSEPSQAEMVE